MPETASTSYDDHQIAIDLRRLVDGEVLSERWERAMYSTDASSYEIFPICVVLPKSESDVVNVVRYAYEKSVPVIARGGGSGLAGQAIGNGIILDLSKYMNRIVEVNSEKSYVIVEPGAYKSSIDQSLKKHGLFLPPDPASSDFCTIGGNIATNASGPRTVKYGSMISYVESLKVVLSNGEGISTRAFEIGEEPLAEKMSRQDLEGDVYRGLMRIIQENTSLLTESMPRTRKNSSGYRLESILLNNTFDVGKVFVSSEGTLGIIVQARLRVVRLPPSRALVLLQFATLEKAGDAVREILKLNPSAVEMIDHRTLQLAEARYPEVGAYAIGVAAIILVEFDGESEVVLREHVQSLNQLLTRDRSLAFGFHEAFEKKEIEKLWEIRRKALPIAQKARKGTKRAIAFIEDAAVDPDVLAQYLQEVYEVYRKYGVEGVVYGHAGDGHLHTRPLLDMKSGTDLRILEGIAMEVYSLVKRHYGTMTGEHGDGLVRTPFIPMMYGQQISSLFTETKMKFDPRQILNPGKKVSQAGPNDITQNLRYGTDYERRHTDTALHWGIKANRMLHGITGHEEELDFASEVELCHGCGYCRETSYSVRMCPVYKAGGSELDSCRGRNNVLRWMGKLEGLAKDFELTDEYGEAIYKHCIQCKMCHVDCPSNVNVGKLMAEARARYASVRGLPKGYKYFMDIDQYGRIGCRLAPLSNWLMRWGTFRAIAEKRTGISRKRNFPLFQRKTFPDLFMNYERTIDDRNLSRSVVFFYDTYLNYNAPDLGITIVKVLRHLGVKTIIPPQKSSGLPALVEGAPELGKEIAAYNISNLVPYVRQGIPVVCFSPSAGLSLKMEYLNVLDSEDTRLVSENTMDIHEYMYSLYRKGEATQRLNPVDRDIGLHLHCHTLVQRIEEDVMGLLRLIPKLDFERVEAGCCGVGGSFGFIKDNYEKSMEMGEKLFSAVRGMRKPVYTTGESCMLQVGAGSGRPVGLTMNLLNESYHLDERHTLS